MNGNTLNNLPVTCRSCPDRKACDPLFPIVSPGTHYFLTCGHIQCRACITFQHTREARLESPLACSICRTHLPVATQHVNVPDLLRYPGWLTNNRNKNIFYERSPWYAAKEAFVLDRGEYKEFFEAVCRNATALYQPLDPMLPTFGLNHGVIFTALGNCIEDGLRMSCPELLITELMIVFDDVLFDFMVRKSSAPHHDHLESVRTGDGRLDLKLRANLVEKLKMKYLHMRLLQYVWEEIMRLVASALVEKWSERFTQPELGEKGMVLMDCT